MAEKKTERTASGVIKIVYKRAGPRLCGTSWTILCWSIDSGLHVRHVNTSTISFVADVSGQIGKHLSWKPLNYLMFLIRWLSWHNHDHVGQYIPATVHLDFHPSLSALALIHQNVAHFYITTPIVPKLSQLLRFLRKAVIANADNFLIEKICNF